ncbi:hypothetical protein ABIA39_009082 [Nocardia sp. GAS34]|uniref:hypothetical protein n=1 Tax=unclassified Nocardia TaxID=2637762 RepID=UPI003D24D3D4
MCEEFVIGDRIVWYADAAGRDIAPDDPAAQRRDGVVTVVHRDPDGRVTAYFVERVGLLGAYSVTVRACHRPMRA